MISHLRRLYESRYTVIHIDHIGKYSFQIFSSNKEDINKLSGRDYSFMVVDEENSKSSRYNIIDHHYKGKREKKIDKTAKHMLKMLKNIDESNTNDYYIDVKKPHGYVNEAFIIIPSKGLFETYNGVMKRVIKILELESL